MVKRLVKYFIAFVIVSIITNEVDGQRVGRKNKSPEDVHVEFIKNLRYDSAKIVNINCQLLDIKPLSITMDTPAVYFRKFNSVDSISYGKKLKAKDAAKLIYRIKNLSNDLYAGDPIGTFIPAMSFLFFKDGQIVANIEYSPVSLGMTIQLRKNNKIVYQDYWSVVGRNLVFLFDKICSTYNLACCDFRKSIEFIYKRNRDEVNMKTKSKALNETN